MDGPKQLPLPVRMLLVNGAGACAGVGIGFVVCPATSEGFADAFRPYIIAAAGIAGLVLSGFVTAWLCIREG